MSRAVTGDHVLFDECIDAFRRKDEHFVPFNPFPWKSYSFILTPFELTSEWDLGICTVSESIVVVLPGAYAGFISKVANPEWVGTHNSHLFGIALSAIISFVTSKPCKSTRDDYLCREQSLSEQSLLELAIQHPILTAGPGSTKTRISSQSQDLFCSQTYDLVSKLMDMEYSKYRVVMQSIRLSHLSLATKRDDFGLSYLLCVSAIESIAQKAIKRDKVKKKHSHEKLWKERAKIDKEFEILLNEYKEARGRNEYLRERFVKFLQKYAPVSEWLDYIEHPNQDLVESIEENSPEHNAFHLVEKKTFEKYPEDLSEEEIELLISNIYVHRSCFVHRGEQPPHKEPRASTSRFFQKVHDYDNSQSLREYLLPNHELLVSLCRNSILNWLK